jgi:outer membrane protein insertion porin family
MLKSIRPLAPLVLVLSSLLLFPAFAQQTPLQTQLDLTQQAVAGPLEDILIEGTDDDVLKGRIKISLDVEPGNLVENIQTETIRTRVLELGLFSEVKVSVRVTDGKNYLVITVTPNPKIGAVEIKGDTILDVARLKAVLEERYTLAPGVIVDNARLEEVRSVLGQIYRQNFLPFVPEIKLEVSKPAADNTVTVTYTVNAKAKLKSLTVEGATLVPSKDIQAAFKAALDKGEFNATLYQQALAQVDALYRKQGYRNSGVSLLNTELTDGALKVVVVEIKIVTIDATELGLDPSGLSVQSGDFFNYDKLLEEVRRLNKDRDKQVGLKVEQTSEDGVAVTITLGEAAAGPIKEIKFEGNTAISSEVLQKALKLKKDDVFNAIAAQEDAGVIDNAYQTAGFRIAKPPEVSFQDGVYTIKILELRVIGYEVAWKNPQHRTQDFIILRELPAPGLFNQRAIGGAFERIARLEVINPSSLSTGAVFRTPNPDKPDEVILVLNLEEGATGAFLPQVSYSSRPGEGWAGSVSYQETNLWGLNNGIKFTLQAQPNSAQQFFSSSLSYTIPWIYVDFLDFKQVRTPITFSIFTGVTGNTEIPGQKDKDKDGNLLYPLPLKDGVPITDGLLRTYTTRSSGFGLSVSRPILENLFVSFGVNYSYNQNFLEGGDGTKFSPNLPDAAAEKLLRQKVNDSSTVFATVEGVYSTRNRDDFPTAGFSVSALAGYGFGVEGARNLNWTKFTAGYRTYLGFGFDDKGEFNLGEDRNMALAFRLNAGTLLGEIPTGQLFRVGDTGGDVLTLRGFRPGDLTGEVYYSGSLEYRYNFGLKTDYTYGLFGIGFLDFGNAWGSVARTPGIGEGIQFGYGLGVQLNLQLGPIQIPPLGFYYGWGSPLEPYGRFHFALGVRF